MSSDSKNLTQSDPAEIRLGYDDVRVLQRDSVFQGFFRVDRLVLQHRRYAGDWSAEITRELFINKAAVGVLLHDPKRHEVVLVEQFRAGALSTEQNAADGGRDPHLPSGIDSPWMLELVAGLIDTDESAQRVAQREVAEEAGCHIAPPELICEYLNSPGCTNESISLFYAEVDASQISGIHGLAEEHEDIRVVVLPVRSVWEAAQQGRIANAMTLIAIQWMMLKHYSQCNLP